MSVSKEKIKTCESCKFYDHRTRACLHTNHVLTFVIYPEIPCPDYEEGNEITLKSITITEV